MRYTVLSFAFACALLFSSASAQVTVSIDLSASGVIVEPAGRIVVGHLPGLRRIDLTPRVDPLDRTPFRDPTPFIDPRRARPARAFLRRTVYRAAVSTVAASYREAMLEANFEVSSEQMSGDSNVTVYSLGDQTVEINVYDSGGEAEVEIISY